MTLHIADIASYQGSLSLADLEAAGFRGINVKVSHGVGTKAVHPKADGYVREARARGMALSCFHWLTAEASGTAQADYAYRQMALLGLNVPGVAHVVDIESTDSPPTQAIIADYVQRMTHLTQRFVIIYTGDWYWPKTWAAPSAYLWAAPNAGYQAGYPGDASPMWDAGYGGWTQLTAMQYRVGKVAGIDVSQTAVRSLDLWAELTGVPRMAWQNIPSLLSLRNEFNAAFPGRDTASDGFVGDTSHAASSSDHNPDETGNTPYEDSDSINEVHAYDADKDLRKSGWTMGQCTEIIRKRHESGQDNRLQNIIYNRRITSRSWGWSEWREYTGTNAHTEHAHFSARYGSGAGTSNPENDTSPWGILAAMNEEDDMTPAEMTAWAKSAEGKDALARAVLGFDPGDNATGDAKGGVANPDFVKGQEGANATFGPSYALNRAVVAAKLGYEIRDLIKALPTAPQVDVQALASAILAGLPETALTPQDVEQALRNVLLQGAGPAS